MNKELQELEQKIQQMKAEGNREGEAALRTQKAMMLVLNKNMRWEVVHCNINKTQAIMCFIVSQNNITA